MDKTIPTSWTYTELDELLLYAIGGDWGKDPSFNSNDYSLAYCIRGSEYRNWDRDKGRTASLRKIKNSNLEARKLQEGDILVEISGGGPEQPVGRTVLIDKSVLAFEPEIPKIHTNFLRLIRSSALVNSKYLNYCLNNYYNTGEVVKIQAGSNNLRNLKFPNYLKVNIALAPLNEQNRIVDKLDELLSELEKGKEQLQTSLEQLKVYRQSILKHAFENTKRLPVGDLYDFVGGGTPSKRNANYWKGNIPWASVKDIKGDFLTKTQDKISEAGLKDSASNLAKPNDVILITRIIPGRPIIAKIETAINQDLKIVKPKVELIPKFIYYTFKSIERQCLKVSSGTTVLGINLVKLKEIDIPYLELNEQELVVQEIERRLSECDKLEETIILLLSQSEITKKSLLQKAFEGKLVEHDPTDEQASVLLDRIKKEREEFLKAEKERKKQKSPMSNKNKVTVEL